MSILFPLREASAYVPHAPIYIGGDSGFTAANGVTGGSGTPGDPYVIEGWEIDSSGWNGIEIRNTNATFVVRGVYVHAVASPHYGILFYSVVNGALENATISGVSAGVSIDSSTNVSLTANAVSGNGYGIALWFSRNVSLTKNMISLNTVQAVFVYSSENVHITANEILNNADGVHLTALSSRVSIIANNVSGNGNGIWPYAATDVSIIANNISGNAAGIYATQFATGISITGNIVSSNDYGIYLLNTVNASVDGNAVSGGTFGILLGGVKNVSVTANSVSDGLFGIRTVYSTDVSVYHNGLVRNTFQGIDDRGSENAWDNGYPSGGNYWSDYTGVDNCSGQNQDVCPDPDGIGDKPYVIDGNSTDRYPLMGLRPEWVRPEAPTLVGAELAGTASEDLRLTWLSSFDEGLPGGTVAYRIQRSPGLFGPYATVATIPGNRSASYDYLCAGCGYNVSDSTTSFFRIRAVDAANNTANSNLAAKFARAVVPGWNLLGVPASQSDWSIPRLLRTVSFDIVRTYRNSDAGNPWKAYYASRPSDLSELGWGDGAWVNITAAGVFTVAGLLAPVSAFPLALGWNLVSYASFVSKARATSLANVSGVAAVEGFDAGSRPYGLRPVAGDQMLVPGDAYWIWIRDAPGGIWVQG